VGDEEVISSWFISLREHLSSGDVMADKDFKTPTLLQTLQGILSVMVELSGDFGRRGGFPKSCDDSVVASRQDSCN
jgi:hypothetical protein